MATIMIGHQQGDEGADTADSHSTDSHEQVDDHGDATDGHQQGDEGDNTADSHSADSHQHGGQHLTNICETVYLLKDCLLTSTSHFLSIIIRLMVFHIQFFLTLWLRCFIHRLISTMHQTCTRLLLNSSVDLLRVIKLRC